MLIKITDKCRMGCMHCMDNAKSSGTNFMDESTFKDAVIFSLQMGSTGIVISGAEPTEHPNIWNYLYYLSSIKGIYVVLTTNGMNINDSMKDTILDIFNKFNDSTSVFAIQVSTGKYYPIKIDTNQEVFKLPFVQVDDMSEYPIYPLGRARDNNIPWSRKASHCFNIRSIVRSAKSLKEFISYSLMLGKCCIPSITYDGHLHLGESLLCPAMHSTIWDNEETIVDEICNFKCDKCDIINKRLSVAERAAIGD